jgi:hypothetical protein
MRRLTAALAVATTAGLAALAVAQAPPKQRPVLHEDMPSPAEAPTPMIGDAKRGNAPPTAFIAGTKVVPRPAMDRPDPSSGKPAEPVLGKGGFAADRMTTMKADEDTRSDNTLHYVSVFNPDVLPFKRMTALDGVGADESLHVNRATLVEVPIGGTTDKSRDRFWGSVLIQLQPGQDVPLPSVAPDMRILSYDIKPKVALHFEKDGADNFYVRSDEASAGGTYRLVWLADADAGYFAPSLPSGGRYTARLVSNMVPPELRPTLPPELAKQARKTLDKIGIDEDEDLGVSFNKLVGYFRAFTAKPIPHATGDVYRDLSDSQAGVCRHRAFAFMITANALGIPTRFVENEAHAFVEVWFPGRRWQRIDLGGAALHMDVTGADNKTLHRPRAEDPFEKPAAYKQSYTQLEGDIKGLTSQQIDDKHKPLDAGTASGSFDGGSGSGSGATPPPDRITPDPTLPYATQDPHKATPVLIVTTADASAYRGDAIHVEGRASANGKPIPDHDVSVFLSPAGAGGAKSMFIGTAVTGPDGGFKQDFSVPSGIGVATYDIWLSSSEDAYYNAALSVQ